MSDDPHRLPVPTLDQALLTDLIDFLSGFQKIVAEHQIKIAALSAYLKEQPGFDFVRFEVLLEAERVDAQRLAQQHRSAVDALRALLGARGSVH